MPHWGGRDGLRWHALSGHWLSCTGCWLNLLSMKLLMCGTLFLHTSTSLWCLCPRTIFTEYFTKKGLDKLLRASSIWDLHTLLRIISGDVPGLTTDSPCGVKGGRGRSTRSCMMVHSEVWVYNCQLVIKVDMVERDFSPWSLALFTFIHPSFPYYFSSQSNLFSNNFFIISTLHWHFP